MHHKRETLGISFLLRSESNRKQNKSSLKMSSKIPVQYLLQHITNVINACVSSSVTVCKLKEYLKHKFKDRLPCDNELDVILEKAVSSAGFSQALTPSLVTPVGSNYKSSSDSSNGNEIRDQNFQYQEISKKRVVPKKRILKTTGYYLDHGIKPEPNANFYPAIALTLEISGTSETRKIFKPLLINEKGKGIGKRATEVVTQVVKKGKGTGKKTVANKGKGIGKRTTEVLTQVVKKEEYNQRNSWRQKKFEEKMQYLKNIFPNHPDEQLERIIKLSLVLDDSISRCIELNP